MGIASKEIDFFFGSRNSSHKCTVGMNNIFKYFVEAIKNIVNNLSFINNGLFNVGLKGKIN